jgi:hypothetical protein
VFENKYSVNRLDFIGHLLWILKYC